MELKLAAPAASLPRLERALLAAATAPAGSRSALTTTYYDTADRALNRRGLSLRVREADGRFVQTVKADGAAETGFSARGEWEDEIRGGRPDPEAPSSGARLPEGIAEALRPLFATAVTRTAITLAPSPALRIEAAIDKGEIRGIAAAGAAPISEIELELKHGDPGALFDTALGLLQAAPLRIETRSKSARGYAALLGDAAPPRAVHAQSLPLDPALPAEAALQRIGRACLAQLLHNEAAALAGDPEGVHQMRVALRRIRAAVAVFEKLLPAAARRQVSDELARLDGVLGAARNLDVLAGGLLPASRAARPGDTGLDRLAAALDAARRSAHARVRDLILSPDYTGAVLRLLRWFEAMGWRGAATAGQLRALARPIGEAAPPLLDRSRRQLRKRGKGFRRAGAGKRHKLRIALKQLRYAGEFFGGFFDPQAARGYARRLKALQDALGYANDVRVARDILAQLARDAADRKAIAAAGARVLAWHRRAVDRGEGRLRTRLRRLERTAPFWRADHPAAVAIPVGQATPVPPSPQ